MTSSQQPPKIEPDLELVATYLRHKHDALLQETSETWAGLQQLHRDLAHTQAEGDALREIIGQLRGENEGLRLEVQRVNADLARTRFVQDQVGEPEQGATQAP